MLWRLWFEDAAEGGGGKGVLIIAQLLYALIFGPSSARAAIDISTAILVGNI